MCSVSLEGYTEWCICAVGQDSTTNNCIVILIAVACGKKPSKGYVLV